SLTGAKRARAGGTALATSAPHDFLQRPHTWSRLVQHRARRRGGHRPAPPRSPHRSPSLSPHAPRAGAAGDIATVIGVAILDALCARRMTLGEGTTARPPAAASWR